MEFCFATASEKEMALPGDECIESPTLESTRAVTIRSPVENVWPWIVQLGQNRGGFYSYTFLENLLGCQMKNAHRIHEEWQQLNEGDLIRLHPKFKPMVVTSVESNRHLVLKQNLDFDWTWGFVCLGIDENQTRLLVRTRLQCSSWRLFMLLYPVMTLGHYVMERRMCVGIKQRCE